MTSLLIHPRRLLRLKFCSHSLHLLRKPPQLRIQRRVLWFRRLQWCRLLCCPDNPPLPLPIPLLPPLPPRLVRPSATTNPPFVKVLALVYRKTPAPTSSRRRQKDQNKGNHNLTPTWKTARIDPDALAGIATRATTTRRHRADCLDSAAACEVPLAVAVIAAPHPRRMYDPDPSAGHRHRQRPIPSTRAAATAAAAANREATGAPRIPRRNTAAERGKAAGRTAEAAVPVTESGIRDTGRRTTTGIVAVGVIEAGKAEGMTDTAAIADTTSVDTLGIDDTNEKCEWFSNKKGENGTPKHYVLS